MPNLFFGLMKRSPSSSMHSVQQHSNAPHREQHALMAPGSVRADSLRSSHSDAMSTGSKDEDYRTFLSDVVVVGAGPSGLMLAYVTVADS